MPSDSTPHLQLRVKFGPSAAVGPGKADLLQHIAETGSISAAARRMRMSYKRAWQLVDEMNGYFRAPLVETAAGGSAGGGARLSATGTRVLAAYRALQRETASAARRELALFARLAATPRQD